MNFLICEGRIIQYPKGADFSFSSYLIFVKRKGYNYLLFFYLLLEMMDTCFLVISGLSLLLERPPLHTPISGSEGASIF